MKYERLFHLNIFSYLQQDVLGNYLYNLDSNFNNYTTIVKDAVLTFDSTDSLNNESGAVQSKRKKISRRVWKSKYDYFVYWFPNEAEEVRLNGAIVAKTKYQINYKSGKIIFGKTFGESLKEDSKITFTGRVPQLTVVNAFTNNSTENPNLPYVVLESLDTIPTPYELGSNDFRELKYKISIHANDEGSLFDLNSIILENFNFKQKRIIDFNKQLPLKELGQKNPLFNIQDLQTPNFISFENASALKIRFTDSKTSTEHISNVFFSAFANKI